MVILYSEASYGSRKVLKYFWEGNSTLPGEIVPRKKSVPLKIFLKLFCRVKAPLEVSRDVAASKPNKIFSFFCYIWILYVETLYSRGAATRIQI